MRRVLRKTAWVGVIFGAVLAGGCAGTQRQVRGVTFEFSGRESGLVEEYEQSEPTAATGTSRCGYWSERVGDARGSHTVGFLSWPSEYFEHLRRWVEAKKDDACRTADTERLLAEQAHQARKDEQQSGQRAQQERRDAEVAQKLAVVSAEEVKSGRCAQSSVDILRSVTSGLAQLLSGMGSGSEFWTVDSHELVVATREGTALNMQTGIGGDIHLFAISPSGPTQLEMTDARGYAIRTESPYAPAFARFVGGSLSSRNVHLNSAEAASLRVKGHGCALVILARKQ